MKAKWRFLALGPYYAKSAGGTLVVVLAITGCPWVDGRWTSMRSAEAAEQRPLVIAHRAGTADAPENTLVAIDSAIVNKADIMWLSVQLSKEGVPVLYRPADLATLTQASGAAAGKVADKTVKELQQLNAGWAFQQLNTDGTVSYPYRSQQLPIPLLEDALRRLPTTMPVILDMKALPAEPQVQAVVRVLEQQKAWSRVMIYSTDVAYQQAFQRYPQARVFESRDATRARLAGVALAQHCEAAPATGTWAGFEYRRELELVERFTLGQGSSKVKAVLWTPASVACFRSQGKTTIIAFGVNTAEDYYAATCLGIDAVLADSPKTMNAIKHSCPALSTLGCGRS